MNALKGEEMKFKKRRENGGKSAPPSEFPVFVDFIVCDLCVSGTEDGASGGGKIMGALLSVVDGLVDVGYFEWPFRGGW